MKNSVKWLLDKLGRNRNRIIILSFLLSVYSVFGIVYALLFKQLADAAISQNASFVKTIFIQFVIVLLIQVSLNAFIRRTQERCLIDIDGILKKHLLSEILNRDYGYVTDIHSGDWMNLLTSDISVICQSAISILPGLSSIFIQILSSCIVLSVYIPSFMVLLFIIVICALLIEFFFYRYIKVLHKDVQEKDGSLRVFLRECINSLTVIKSYTKEVKTLSDMNGYLDDYRKAREKKNDFSIMMNFFFGIVMNGVLVLAGIYCAYEIMQQQISYGVFIAVIQIITQIRGPLAKAYGYIPNFYSMIGSIERLKAIEEEADREDTETIEIDDHFKEINIDQISFSYHDNDNKEHIIDDFSVSIHKGDFIGISGPSGCGKSTLFRLLLSLYQPIKGEITITYDDKHVLDHHYRKLFAYVPQDNQLMKGTIKDVICFGETYDPQKMEEVLNASCCDEFIHQIGIHSELKESGSGLSEGQMQRIAIARALYSDRSILLLDEVTSALNEELELQILQNLRNMKDKTVLLITHRKSALEYTDQVIYCYEKEGKYLWKNGK